MAIVYVEEFDVGDDRSTTNYDAVTASLKVEADPPKGLIVHSAGFVGDQFHIVDVWETVEDQKRFYEGRVMPAVMRLVSESDDPTPPTRTYSYEVHDLLLG